MGERCGYPPSVHDSVVNSRVAVMSDSHDDLSSVDAALALIRAAGISHVIHCGDIVSPRVVKRLASWRVDWVLGNCDTDPAALSAAVRSTSGHVLHGWSARFRWGELDVGVTHGHLSRELSALQQAGCRWIIHGHSHQVRDQPVDGVRFLNPGALHRARPRTFMIVDRHAGTVSWIDVPRPT